MCVCVCEHGFNVCHYIRGNISIGVARLPLKLFIQQDGGFQFPECKSNFFFCFVGCNLNVFQLLELINQCSNISEKYTHV